MDISHLPVPAPPPLPAGYLRMRFEQTFLHVILWIPIRPELLCVDLTQGALPQGRILRLRALYLILIQICFPWETSLPPHQAPAFTQAQPYKQRGILSDTTPLR